VWGWVQQSADCTLHTTRGALLVLPQLLASAKGPPRALQAQAYRFLQARYHRELCNPYEAVQQLGPGTFTTAAATFEWALGAGGLFPFCWRDAMHCQGRGVR
jgi:hypothetical protein